MKHFTLLFSLLFGAALVISACGTAPEPDAEEVVRFTHSTPPGWSPIRAGTGKSVSGEPIHLHFVGVPKDLRIQRVVPPNVVQDVDFRIEGPREYAAVRVLGPFSLVDSALDLRVSWSTGAMRIQFGLITF